MHMITQPMYFVTDDKSVVSKDVLKKLITLDLNDKKENEIKNIASVSHKTKVKSCADTNDIILTYFHGENKYWFYVEKKPFAKGYFKLSYRGTVYKTDITTNSVIGTPIIADGMYSTYVATFILLSCVTNPRNFRCIWGSPSTDQRKVMKKQKAPKISDKGRKYHQNKRWNIL
eukprot:1031652_1